MSYNKYRRNHMRPHMGDTKKASENISVLEGS